jgi:hypothetical protein
MTTTQLVKAALYELKDGPPAAKGRPQRVKVTGAPIQVQFNPTSLKITRSNNVDHGGATTRVQKRQNPSVSPATLSFDLEYDTAEGDESGQPVDVRTKTAPVRRFVEPPKPSSGKPADPPPRVLFLWGTLNFAGIVTSLTEDIDYFSADGMALRSRLSITITEQNLAFESLTQGAGSRDDSSATEPGGGSSRSAPGSSGTANPTAAALAQAGESLQQLLARLDEDPAAWRAAMNGLSGPIGLGAGAQVQLRAGLAVSGGIGVAAGFTAGAQVSAAASLGAALSVSAGGAAATFAGTVGVAAGAGVGAAARTEAGFALAAGGGIASSLNLVTSAGSDATVSAARASFSVPPGRPTSGSLGVSAVASAGAGAAVVDPRATTYGASIPLGVRATVTSSSDAAFGGDRSLTARAQSGELRLGTSVQAPWQQLPAASADRARADATQRGRDAAATTMRRTSWR